MVDLAAITLICILIMTSGGLAVGRQGEYWLKLRYLPYGVLHKKWQCYLFEMVKEKEGGRQIKEVIDRLYGKYPRGLVANIQKGEVPRGIKSLAKYLAKYVVSPPISVRRIISYNGERVKYCYHDHKSGRRKEEEVDVYTFNFIHYNIPQFYPNSPWLASLNNNVRRHRILLLSPLHCD